MEGDSSSGVSCRNIAGKYRDDAVTWRGRFLVITSGNGTSVKKKKKQNKQTKKNMQWHESVCACVCVYLMHY